MPSGLNPKPNHRNLNEPCLPSGLHPRCEDAELVNGIAKTILVGDIVSCLSEIFYFDQSWFWLGTMCLVCPKYFIDICKNPNFSKHICPVQLRNILERQDVPMTFCLVTMSPTRFGRNKIFRTDRTQCPKPEAALVKIKYFGQTGHNVLNPKQLSVAINP